MSKMTKEHNYPLSTVHSKLPMGWEIKKLGEVCETGAGGTPLKTHKDYYEGGTIPWLLSGEVSQGEIFEAKNFITEKGLKNSSAKSRARLSRRFSTLPQHREGWTKCIFA